MRSGFALLCALMALAVTPVWGQTVEELQQEVLQLRREMAEQAEAFTAQITEMNTRLDTTVNDELKSRISDIVAEKSLFYQRPAPGTSQKRFLFETLTGGLVFTGLFRSRFEYRQNNIDFNSGPSGLDDRGVRFNGRFRLGIGAVLLGGGEEAKGDPNRPEITALTEFQAVGTFANNSFVNIPGPGTVPLPSAFNILTEPFEEMALYQGYLHFERLLGREMYLKVGRQEIIFGNEFVLGNNAFYDGTVHDAILAQWKPGNLSISAFFAIEAASDSNLVTGITDFNEDHFAGLYATWEASRDVVVDAYALFFNSRSVTPDLFLTGSTAFYFDGAVNPVMLGHFWTLGTRFFWTGIDFLGGGLTLNAEAAFQTGKNSLMNPAVTFTNQSIHGWAGEFVANWRIDPVSDVQPMFTLGYYYAGGGKRSGTATGYPLREIGFQPLFINRHFDVSERGNSDRPYYPGGGRYGNMDIIPLNNVHIAKAGFSIAPSLNTEIGVDYVLAVTADDEGYGTGLFGHEIDLFGVYQYSRNLQFVANFSVFFPGRAATAQSQLLFFPPGSSGGAGGEMAFAFYLQALIQF